MKKTFLILFSASLLLLVLSLGQEVLAEVCTPQPTNDLGCTGTPDYNCINIEIFTPAELTANYTCKSCACAPELYFPNTDRRCCKKNTPISTCPTCRALKCLATEITNPDKTLTCTNPTEVCCIVDDTSDPEDGGGDVKDKDPYGGVNPGGGGAGSITIGPDSLSPIGNPSIPELIGIIVKGALGIVGSVSLLLFVYGGFIMLISQGDATKITKGKNIMIWTSIGLMIIFGSYIFVSYIVSNLG